jgi:hypothetical protein
VACLTKKDDTAVKSRTCKFESHGETKDVDYFAVKWDVSLREAKTGKEIAHLGTVNGPASDCPFLSYFNPNDPKIYGAPDPMAVSAKIEEFAST